MVLRVDWDKPQAKNGFYFSKKRRKKLYIIYIKKKKGLTLFFSSTDFVKCRYNFFFFIIALELNIYIFVK